MPLSEALEKELKRVAKRAAQRAYAPYSGFKVGAAVATAGRRIYSGCNVENASYGLTICAERNALFHAVAEGRRTVLAVVIYGGLSRPASPCGACRQVISEFGPHAEVLSFNSSGNELRGVAGDLLPEAFKPADLSS